MKTLTTLKSYLNNPTDSTAGRALAFESEVRSLVVVLFWSMLTFMLLIPRFYGFSFSLGGIHLPYLSVSRLVLALFMVAWLTWVVTIRDMGSFSYLVRIPPGLWIALAFFVFSFFGEFFSGAPDGVLIEGIFSESLLLGLFLAFIMVDLLAIKALSLRELWLGGLCLLGALLALSGAELVLGSSIYSYFPIIGDPLLSSEFFSDVHRLGLPRIHGPFDNHISLGVAILLLIGLLFSIRRNLVLAVANRHTSDLIVGLSAIILFFTVSRIVWLAGLVLLIIWFWERRSWLFGVLLLGISFTAIVVWLIPDLQQEVSQRFYEVVLFQDRDIAQSSLYKQNLFLASWRTFRENWLFGVGLDHFELAVQGDHEGRIIRFVHHEHVFVTLAVELGLWGILTLLFSCGIFLYLAFCDWSKKYLSTGWLAGLAALFFTLFVTGQAIDWFSKYDLMVIIWVLLGCVMWMRWVRPDAVSR